MWYELHLLVSSLTSFLGQSIYNSNEKWAPVNSIETTELPSSLNHQLEMPDFSQYTTRISEKKCMEYVYDMLKRQEKRNLGHSDVNIINGKVVKEAEYPHMGALGWWSYVGTNEKMKLVFLCGASLISDRFMLTAAHCTWIDRQNLVQHTPQIVRLGSRYLENSPREVPKDIVIQRIIRCSHYLSPRPYFDIALIKLNETVKFSKFIQPACLNLPAPYRQEKNYGNWMGSCQRCNFKAKIPIDKYEISAKSKAAPPSVELRSTEIHILEQETCDHLLKRFSYRYWMGLKEHQLCAGELDGKSDTCQGDSGGPLQYALVNSTSEGTIHRILAITTFGLTRCATKNAPGVYTEIFYFIRWIERNVWPFEYAMFNKTKCTKDLCT